MPAGSARTAEKTNGVSDHFLLWSRFGPRTQLDGSYLHGTRERERADKLQQKYYYPFCTQHNASVLAAGVLSTAPRHMRSDVDRVVFGRDMDASEAAEVADGQGSNWDKGKLEAPAAASDAPPANALLERLQAQGVTSTSNLPRLPPLSPRAGGNVSWAGEPASYINIQPLNVNTKLVDVPLRRMGAMHPSTIQPRTLNAAATLRAMRQTDFYKDEMDKLRRLGQGVQNHRQTPRPHESLSPRFDMYCREWGTEQKWIESPRPGHMRPY